MGDRERALMQSTGSMLDHLDTCEVCGVDGIDFCDDIEGLIAIMCNARNGSAVNPESNQGETTP